MRFYRAWRTTDGGNSGGFQFFTSKEAAEKYVRMWRVDDPGERAGFDPIDITPTKAGLLRFLNIYASHPDNG